MLEIKQKPHQRVVHHTNKFRPIIRAVQRLLIAMTILAVILITGALIYTWYNGKYGEQPKATATLPKKSASSRQPTKPSAIGKIGVSVQFLTSPIAPGENATITVRTNADANCTIKVEYNNVLAKDSGLVPKKANEFGMATWGWTVPIGTPLGKWPVTVTCANLKYSGMVIGDLVVTKTPTRPTVAN
jgi:hypothetical protein